jgi:type I restriction enzyme S subunit
MATRRAVEMSKKSSTPGRRVKPGASTVEAQLVNAALERQFDASSRRFRPYPGYKNSGVEWLGQIPEHWDVKKLCWITKCLDGRRIPLNAEERSTMRGEYPYWGANSIVDYLDRWLFNEDLVLLGEDGAPFLDPLKPVAFRVRGKIWVNNHAHVLRPLPTLDPRFLAYVLNCVDYRAMIDGTTRDKLTQADMRAIPVQYPSLPEQGRVVAFLDRETEKIDTLIAKKEQLIKLLQEKRAALVTRAVTRGLNPSATMKESDLEWLSEIPLHWKKQRMAYLAKMISGGTPSKENVEYWRGEIPWVSPKDMKSRIIADAIDHVSVAAVEKTGLVLVEPPVVLIVVRGMILAHSFPVAYTTVPVTVNQDMKALLLIDGIDHNYFVYFLEGISRFVLSLIEEAGHGTKRLRTDFWRSLDIYLPTLGEQMKIAAFLDHELRGLRELTERIANAIARLKELRTALISSAVTGKIDVREEIA